MTDSDGLASFPKDKISLNDTIKVTFIGMQQEQVVCNTSVLNEGKYKFILKQNDIITKCNGCDSLSSFMNTFS